MMTFTPHPQKVIASGSAPQLLQTQRQKTDLLAETGLDLLLCVPFTRRLSLYTPEEFARRILHDHGIREIHVGGNFRFGHRRSGDIRTLAALGDRFGFEVVRVSPVGYRGKRISSSLIRSLLTEGRVALAKRLLGRPYRIEGLVVRGDGRGAGLGFPTANLEPENELVPAAGVYATRAYLEEGCYPSVTNIGFRPTVDDQARTHPVIEVHLLDTGGNLYGRAMGLDFCARLRREERFASVEQLIQRIGWDVECTRRYRTRVERMRRDLASTEAGWPMEQVAEAE